MSTTLNLNNAVVTDYTNAIKEVVVDPQDVQGVNQEGETRFQNSQWTQQVAYWKKNADLKNALVLKSQWAFGGNWTADPRTQIILDHISGNGKQTFDDIIQNMNITSDLGGNSYAEIVTDKGLKGAIKSLLGMPILLNLKVLNTGKMVRIYNSQGIIVNYEYPVNGKPHKFKPEEILDFSSDTLADEICGTSLIDALEETIKAENACSVDKRKWMHTKGNFLIWKLKTDDETKITNWRLKLEAAKSISGEDICVPDDDDTVSVQIVQTPINPAIFQYYDSIITKFYRCIGMPTIVPGATGGVTENSSKVAEVNFTEGIKSLQLKREKQIWQQLQLRVKFNPPTDLMQNLQQDQMKDGTQGLQGGAFQPNDVQLGVGK